MRFSSHVREAGSLEKPEEPLTNLRVKGAKFFLQRTVLASSCSIDLQESNFYGGDSIVCCTVVLWAKAAACSLYMPCTPLQGAAAPLNL